MILQAINRIMMHNDDKLFNIICIMIKHLLPAGPLLSLLISFYGFKIMVLRVRKSSHQQPSKTINYLIYPLPCSLRPLKQNNFTLMHT